jgi:hypothetical protein
MDPGWRRMSGQLAGLRSRLATPRTAVLLGVLVLVLAVLVVPLAVLAGATGDSSGGGEYLGPAFGLVGFLVAWRRPGNPLGWLLLGAVGFLTLSSDAGLYAVAAYRVPGSHLPLGWVAVLLQPGWAPAISLFGLSVLLFPDGRLPRPRWRWALWAYVSVAVLWTAGVFVISVQVIAAHQIRVDSSGNLLAIDHPAGPYAWWGHVQQVFFPVLGACWLASVIGQVISYRRSSGERRLQLKWLVGGSVVAVAGGLVAVPLTSSPNPALQAIGSVALIAVLALPVSMGVAILKYRLYDIDRIISRTLAYALVTGLLVGVYAGLVLLATQVLRFSSSVAVAASTLAAAALFYPLRARVQRAVDRRFNRARYDADAAVAAFAGRLQDAVDLDKVRDDLLTVVRGALQPDQLWVYVPHADADAARGAER